MQRRDREVLVRATQRAYDGFMAALRPIYEDGILAAGRRPFLRARDLARLHAEDGAAWGPRCRCTRSSRATSATRACARRSRSTRSSSAATPSACRRSTPRSSTSRSWTRSGTPAAARGASSRRWRARSTCAAAPEVQRIERTGGRVTGVVLEGGERLAADVVVSNADVLHRRALLGEPPGGLRGRQQPTMSCFLLYLGTDRVFDRLQHHTLLVGRGYRRFIARRDPPGTARRRRSRPTSTRRRGPSRAWRARAATRSRCCCRSRTSAAGIDWAREADGLRDALVADLERTFGLEGLDDSVVVEHRMTPLDFARELGAVDGNAFSVEPTLHQRAWFRLPNRDPAVRRALPRRRRDAPGRGDARRAARAPRSRPASSPRTTPGPPGRSEDGVVLLQRPEPEADALLAEAREHDPPRRADVRARLPPAPAPTCATTSTASTSSSARSTTSSTSTPPDAPAAVAAVEAWCEDGSVRLARGGRARRPGHAARPPPPRPARLLPRDARRPRGAAGPHRGRRRPLLLPRRGHGRGRHGRGARHATARAPTARPRRSGWPCSARTSCATSTRTARSAAATVAQETLGRFGGDLRPGGREALVRDQIARADALYDEGVAGIGALPPGPLRDRRGRRDVPRDPAPDRARGLRRARGPRRGLGAPQAPRRRAGAAARGLTAAARCGRGVPMRRGVAAPGAGARLAVPA